MNEERQNERDSQLSAMFDGELPAVECELLARRLTRDEALRAQWSRYALIGAALRAERGVALHDRVAWRVQSAIAQEPSYGDSAAVDANPARAGAGSPPAAARAPGAARWMRFARPVAGASIAAGVAAVSILWLRTQDTDGLITAPVADNGVSLTLDATADVLDEGLTIAMNPTPAVVTESAEPFSTGEAERYTTPAPSTRVTIGPPARLANYVVAHSEYSGPLSRRLALVGLVGSDVAEPVVEEAPARTGTDDGR